jgi:hypothetical protein
MTSTHAYLHPKLPAFIRIYEPGFDIGKEFDAVSVEDIALLDAQTKKVYYIMDIQVLTVSFEDLVAGASLIGRTEVGQKRFHHPNVIENIMVVKQRILEIAAQNLKMPSLGAVNFKILHSLEDALAYIEQQKASR